jgi:hypothetical protein
MANYAMAPKKRWFVLEDGKRIAEPFPNTESECEFMIERLNEGLEEKQIRNLTVESELKEV